MPAVLKKKADVNQENANVAPKIPSKRKNKAFFLIIPKNFSLQSCVNGQINSNIYSFSGRVGIMNRGFIFAGTGD